MAIRIERTIIDDLDASTDGVGTYRFGLDGIDYEIDLSSANLQRLRAAYAPFIAAGRRLARTKTAEHTPGGTPPVAAVVRRWWAQHQQAHQLPAWRAHGPIPGQVYAAYQHRTQR